jgi:methylated-DNA-[protein]-cysteine S-methyltransferase
VIAWEVCESPLGRLTVQVSSHGVSSLSFPGRSGLLDERAHDPTALTPAVTQLEEYFGGNRRVFDLPLDLDGTPFERRVWEQLQQIPYGTTTSYGQLARSVGRPDVVREVAAVIGRTPVPIIVPCHRVLAADGALTGYSGGMYRKQALLDLEYRSVTGRDPEPAWPLRQLALL